MQSTSIDDLQTGAAFAASPPSLRQQALGVWRALFARPISAVSTTILLCFVILALIGPMIAPYGENQQIVADARQPPSAAHWFGADHLGRDVFSRIILGARAVMGLSGGGTLLAVILGASLGLLSGYRGGWLDEVLMRFFDSLLSIPVLLLALLLLGALGRSRDSVLLVIAVVYTPIVARVVRSVVLSVKQKSFIEAARLRGESTFYILFREILPSVLPALAVEAALRFSYSIFLVASLGFLGIGVQPPSPNWGMMVNEARDHVHQIPWSMYLPIVAISLLVISVNLVADSLRRILREGGN
jgi:peptide/nickel transport system permease protein